MTVRIILPLIMLWMLLLSALTMEAAAAACSLFATQVMPGLFPYMVLSLMLVSRFQGKTAGGRNMPEWLLLLLGWGGGSPTGARLLGLTDRTDYRRRVRQAVSCATMSPMFLLGTLGSWLRSPAAGMCILLAVVLGGFLTGRLVRGSSTVQADAAAAPLAFGQAVEAAACTMLMVCGTMVMLRVLAALLTEYAGALALPITTLLEVTTGAKAIAELPLPLCLRTAMAAGATGIGGAAVLMQNRACYPGGFMPLWEQALWQGVHGVISFVLALGISLMAGI